MPTAKPLSTAAQAVDDAARDAWASNMDNPRAIAAAALRAAADRTMSSLIGDIYHPKYLEGCEAASAFLEYIVAELEGQL